MASSEESPGSPALLDRMRNVLRVERYSRRTEEAYLGWVRRFIRYHNMRHPATLGRDEVGAFLTHLAVRASVSASTQTQALSALLYLYERVLRRDLGRLPGLVRARQSRRLPVVLTRGEMRAVLGRLDGIPGLVASLLYGRGLRLLEALELRVKDVDLVRRELTVRCGKGQKDRITMLPCGLLEPLRIHLERVRALHRRDLARNAGRVALPDALARMR